MGIPQFPQFTSRHHEGIIAWHETEMTNLMGKLCCAREHSVQFIVKFLYVKLHS
jgi:hypothetical protein